MGRMFRDAFAAVALLSVVATEGKPVSPLKHELLTRQAPVTNTALLPNGWSYLGCFT